MNGFLSSRPQMLIVVDRLGFGGIETTLISLLKFLSYNSNYQIDLIVLSHELDLKKFVPDNVNIILIESNLAEFFIPLRERLKTQIKNKKYKEMLKTFMYLKKFEKLKIGECIRYNVVKQLNIVKKVYDVAIAYTDSSSLFFLNEKVTANKKFVWVHMNYSTKNNRAVWHEVFYKKMDKIICVSRKVKDSFDTLNNKLINKTVVAYNILDFEKIDNMKNEIVKEYDEKFFNILSVGRLSKEKNFYNLIRVFAEVKKNVTQKVRLYIVGEGIERENLQKLIDKLNLNDSCFLLGKKHNPYKYMKKCDLYVQPSVMEGFGMTIMEALYIGKPILSTKIPAAEELMVNNVNGMIVQCNNEELKKSIIRLIEDCNLIKLYEENNRKIVFDNINNILKIIN